MLYDEIIIDGEPYPTRNSIGSHLPPITLRDLYDLTADEFLQLVAIHEAGHAVAHLAGGRAHLAKATVSDEPGGEPGVVQAISYDLHGDAQIVADCAGERAADQWLLRHGLWAPTRAVAVELSAENDRARSLTVPGMTHAKIRAMHDPTDDLLAQHWKRVEAVAAALLQAGTLTGDQVAAVAGLPNLPTPEGITCRA